MRVGLILIVAAFLAGCAAKPATVASAPATQESIRYEDATSSALVFDPPVTAGELPIDLSRDERAPSAFVSFDGPSTTLYWIHTDDLQESEWGGDGQGGMQDRFRRRAVIDKSGVTYR
jgi:hypothetical protein